MTAALDIVVFGLSLSSSWGNGHATTYRALLRGLREEGHRVLFLERDVHWYAASRDLPVPEFCEFELYDDIDSVLSRHAERLARADAVIVGSYVPKGAELIDRLSALSLRRLCFYDIDMPVTLAALARGEDEFLTPAQIPLFHCYLSFTGVRTLDRLERDWGARRARALYCSVEAARYKPTGEATEWELGYLGTYSPDRQPVLERLLIEPARALPRMRFVVAGSQYPDGIDWPPNVERIDHVPPAEHASFYSRQRYTLNVTREDMVAAVWSPSVRLFEAAACGPPVISDEWPGLTEFFPDGETILVARASDDVVATLAHRAEYDRRRIADRARRIVTGRHTGRARARDLVGALLETPVPSRRSFTGARARPALERTDR